MKKNYSLIASLLFAIFLSCQTTFAAPMLLREGSRGEAVRELQTILIELEYLEGKPSGFYDKKNYRGSAPIPA